VGPAPVERRRTRAAEAGPTWPTDIIRAKSFGPG